MVLNRVHTPAPFLLLGYALRRPLLYSTGAISLVLSKGLVGVSVSVLWKFYTAYLKKKLLNIYFVRV